jgi:RNA polymerase sigma factor (sigma-70 family)
MANPLRGSLLGYLRVLLASWEKDPRSDAELLFRFVHSRDEAAFTAMVGRHGKLVWDICCNILGNGPDAEDAFQNTFVLLSRRAGQISKQVALTAWLTTVARRAAWAAGKVAKRQQRLLQQARGAVSESGGEASSVAQAEVAAVLREEIAGLPETLRDPLTQRYLEGKTLSEVADMLGCSIRAVTKRLVRGEDALRRQLARRGFKAGGVALGILLAGESARATVLPSLLESTIRAALAAPPAGTGLVDAVSVVTSGLFAARLSRGVLALAAMLLVGGTVGLVCWWLARSEEANTAPTIVASPENKAGFVRSTVAVSGQVVNDRGEVVPRARVVVVVKRFEGRAQQAINHVSLTKQEADADGRYRLDVPDHFASDNPGQAQVKLLVHAPGYGLAVRRQPLRQGAALVPVELSPEQPLRGRILDPEGRPVRGASVRVVQVGLVVCFDGNPSETTPLLGWPSPVLTDEDGRYVIRGLSRNEHIRLLIEDKRHGMKTLDLPPERPVPTELTLQPPRWLHGRVVAAGSRQPLASVRVVALRPPNDTEYTPLTDISDSQGRFHLPLKPGMHYRLDFLPTAGTPYLGMTQQPCPDRQQTGEEAEFTLPAGVVVKGQITDAASEQPVTNVLVRYIPCVPAIPDWTRDMQNCEWGWIATDADGRFALTVPRGKGHLLVRAQEDEYRVVAADLRLLIHKQLSGRKVHGHAIVPIEPGEEPESREVKIALHRGVSASGTVVRPDGKTVSGGILVCRRRVYPRLEELRPVLLTSGGQFTLPGCEPGRPERVLLLDASEKWGLVTDLTAPQTESQGRVTIQLERCGRARVTFVDGEGKPLAGMGVKLMLTLSESKPLPGPSPIVESKSVFWLGTSYTRIPLTSMSREPIVLPYAMEPISSSAQWPLRTDARGQLRLPSLVPGAGYQLTNETETVLLGQTIQVAPDQELDLRIVVKKP